MDSALAVEVIPPVAQPVLVEYFDDHYYKVTRDGVTHYLPSVTTKLGIIDKPNLHRWREDIGAREADFRAYEAAERGKRIHWAYEIALRGGMVVYDPWKNPVFTDQQIVDLKVEHGGNLAVLRTQDEMVQMSKLKQQYDVLKPFVLGVEEKVFDIENRDAGTIDNILWIDEGDYLVCGAKPVHIPGGIYINDLKTGKFVDENTWLQLAPYAVMWEKTHEMQIAGALITHTGAITRGGIPGLKTLIRDRQKLFEKDYPDYRRASGLWDRDHEGEQPKNFEFPATVTFKQGGIPDGLRRSGNQADVEVRQD